MDIFGLIRYTLFKRCVPSVLSLTDCARAQPFNTLSLLQDREQDFVETQINSDMLRQHTVYFKQLHPRMLS